MHYQFLLIFLFTLKAFSSPLFPGGEDSSDDQTFDAFKNPILSMSPEQKGNFSVGHSFFTNAWVSAPASVKTRDGLGPTFNSVACAGCHIGDGRGSPYVNGTIQPSLLFRISSEINNVWRPDINYGDQINPFAITGVSFEAKPSVNFKEIFDSYPDGTKYSLVIPEFTFTDLMFGPFAKGTQFSPRVAPQMIGLGYIEAIDEKDILKLEDPNDLNNDGISGRANWPIEVKTNKPKLGRFGWKANQPSLEQQNAGAFLGDMGLTTSLFPAENCPLIQVDCQKAPNGGSPEVSDPIFEKVLFYTKTLSVPKARFESEIAYNSGLKIFKDIGCVNCHTQNYTTGKSDLAFLSEISIYPFSDFLLHDMGDELADHRPDHLANGNEWRTPPLWGVGLFKVVNGHSYYLHDGRARSIEEAILWHSGEGKKSRDKFKNISSQERAELINFVNSI